MPKHIKDKKTISLFNSFLLLFDIFKMYENSKNINPNVNVSPLQVLTNDNTAGEQSKMVANIFFEGSNFIEKYPNTSHVIKL